MGSTTSSLVTEIFLLYFEHLVITLNVHNKSVIFAAR
jgi:hypothetical protein